MPGKVALSFPINQFHEKRLKKLAYIYIYINKCFPWRNLCWIWKKLQHNIGFPTIKLPVSTKKFYDWPVQYYFWQIWYMILGYWIKLSCLYIPQGHHFISTLWLCPDEYIFILFWAKSTFKSRELEKHGSKQIKAIKTWACMWRWFAEFHWPQQPPLSHDQFLSNHQYS